MSLTLYAVIGIAVLFLLMFLRMPISFSMLIVGFAGLYAVVSSKAAFTVVSGDLWSQFSSYSLSVIPLYVFMGEIVFRSGITERLFQAAYKWVGHYRGGMIWTVILASAGFGSICGSNSATSATIGSMALPELKKFKYSDTLSTGSVAGGGSLGIIIPPSTVLLVIAIQAQLSIKDLFVASIVPSILLVVLFLLVIGYVCWRDPEMAPAAGHNPTLIEKLKAISGVMPTLLLLIFVIGGLFLGWFTPTESGAVGAFGSLAYAVARRKLSWVNFKLAVFDSLRSSAMVIMMVLGALVFGRFLTITRLPFEVADWVTSLTIPSVWIMVMIFVVFVIGGHIMDAFGFLIISIPIFFPAAVQLGYDPIWFAVMMCIITSVGAITPPFGINVFVVKGLVPDVPVMSIFKGSLYYVYAYLICIAILTAFPKLMTFIL
ncbi:tripartite ATP-independent transporter DctM subunit [Paenibacillus forsythiae]|uniref:Tripartite ATP-independent transporter DctM subunit n=1 Tax=Paenibacillus forsythiae TaxID=365616 RepID=A0ABU3H4V0_9BACL|nr:TRAP transporter large permease [Paenibacillus forsythiae]MDT3425845.1 tripartite ATP-independent transporter DctM subunit [Paenibacillus forsythiae]